MSHELVAGDDASPSSDIDIEILLPGNGVIQVESRHLFAEPEGPLCRRFVESAFLAAEIDAVIIADPTKARSATPVAELRFDATRYSCRQVLERVAALLDAAPSPQREVELPPVASARDCHGVVRYHRSAQRITGWRGASERICAVELVKSALCRKSVLCEAI